jgi:hypothetical protein
MSTDSIKIDIRLHTMVLINLTNLFIDLYRFTTKYLLEASEDEFIEAVRAYIRVHGREKIIEILRSSTIAETRVAEHDPVMEGSSEDSCDTDSESCDETIRIRRLPRQ